MTRASKVKWASSAAADAAITRLLDGAAIGPDQHAVLKKHLTNLPEKYAHDVVSIAEVETHIEVLNKLREHNHHHQPIVNVRALQTGVPPASPRRRSFDTDEGLASALDLNKSPTPNFPTFGTREEIGSPTSRSSTSLGMPTFGSSANLLALDCLDDETNSSGTKDDDSDHGPIYKHEITFAATDNRKLLGRLSMIISDEGLEILEAHVFSTKDGFALDVFLVSGWPSQLTSDMELVLNNRLEEEFDVFSSDGIGNTASSSGSGNMASSPGSTREHFVPSPPNPGQRLPSVLESTPLDIPLGHDPHHRRRRSSESDQDRVARLNTERALDKSFRQKMSITEAPAHPDPPNRKSETDPEAKDSGNAKKEDPKRTGLLSFIFNRSKSHGHQDSSNSSQMSRDTKNVAQSQPTRPKSVEPRLAPAAEGSKTPDMLPTHHHDETSSSSEDGSVRRVQSRDEIDGDFEINIHDIAIGHKIGSGSFGDIFKGVYGHGPDKQVVAIKTLRIKTAEREVEAGLRDFLTEISLLRRVRHQHIVQMVGAWTSQKPKVAIVMEFCGGGNVSEYLRRNHLNKNLRMSVRLPFILRTAVGVALGVDYLHNCHIIHRDLKASNLLLDDQEKVKVADFGVARVTNSISARDLTAETGTYRWMAPEVVSHKPYTRKCDVFSYSIVLWELLSEGTVPYMSYTPLQAAIAVVQKNLRPAIPKDTPPQLNELMKACWAADEKERPGFDEIVPRISDAAAFILGGDQS